MVRRSWLCAMVVLGGCASGSPGLTIGGALAPNDTCGYDTSSARVHTGILDVATPQVTYTMTALVQNNLLDLSMTSVGVPMANPNTVTVSQAQVELRDVQGNPLALPGLPNPFTVPATGFVPSSDGSEPGVAIAAFQAIPALYGEALRGMTGSIIAVVQVLGVTAGGAEVLSPEFPWTIQLCSGCLFSCARDEDDMPRCQPSCTPGQDSLTISPGACEGVLVGCVAAGG